MIEFANLTNPSTFTIELAILIGSISISYLYGFIKLRSVISGFTWMIMIITLMFTFMGNLQLIWFWITVILASISLFISVMVSFIFGHMV